MTEYDKAFHDARRDAITRIAERCSADGITSGAVVAAIREQLPSEIDKLVAVDFCTEDHLEDCSFWLRCDEGDCDCKLSPTDRHDIGGEG